MNRGTALLLAMAALLAHTLAIYHDASGRFAAPFDEAHAAYHLARNFVHHGELAWAILPEGVLLGGLEDHAAPLLVMIAAVSERLYFPVTMFCQVIGILASLLALWSSASFSIDRSVGIVPPILIVFSGGMATAGASGTHIPLLTAALVLAFVSYEHRWKKRFAMGLLGLVLSSVSGAVMAAGFVCLALLERLRPRRDRVLPPAVWTFLPAMLAGVALFLYPTRAGGYLYASALRELFTPESERLMDGVTYLREFTLTAVIPLLLLFPIVAILCRNLAGVGLRALLMALLWCALVVLRGGGSLVFSLALVPAIPLIAIAVQQGVIAAIDTRRKELEILSWALLLATVCLSMLGSKHPGDLGPLKVKDQHEVWMSTSGPVPFGREAALGRRALQEEIHLSGELRALGSLLRDLARPGESLLTPWPGSLSYLSNLRVIDFFGNPAELPKGTVRNAQDPEEPAPRTDVLALLSEKPSYILPSLITSREAAQESFDLYLSGQLTDLDVIGRERGKRILDHLRAYQLIAIPISPEEGSRVNRTAPFYILRRKDLGLAPRLELKMNAGVLTIDLLSPALPDKDPGYQQTASLKVLSRDAKGNEWVLTPFGEWSAVIDGKINVETRVSLLIYATGTRKMRLFEGPLPAHSDGDQPTELSAYLQNPGRQGIHGFALVAEMQKLTLPR